MNVSSIVLNSKSITDNDYSVNLYTKEKGKIRAIAKGIFKKNSSLRAKIQPFTQSCFKIIETKSFVLITEGEILEFNSSLITDLSKIYCAAYGSRLFIKFIPEKSKDEQLYEILKDYFDSISKVDLRKSEDRDNLSLKKSKQLELRQMAIALDIKFLKNQGILPQNEDFYYENKEIFEKYENLCFMNLPKLELKKLIDLEFYISNLYLQNYSEFRQLNLRMVC